MTTRRIGILHPGEMGISIAASAQHGGSEVWWASDGRRLATRVRAEQQGLIDGGSVAALCRSCGIIVSVCPPHAAEAVAEEVAAGGFSGLYIDANAIAPARAIRIGALLQHAGAAFVDGGIIGGPAWQPGKTWLCLSGPRAADAASCFSAGPLETQVLGSEIGAASALKMCYAAYAKGITALLCAVLGAAERLGVRGALDWHWARDEGAAAAAAERVGRSLPKAWRYVGEMDEIASTFRSAGLPGEFHDASAEIYRRLSGFKDAPAAPSLDDMIAGLLAGLAEPDTMSRG
jgi:3-hydroxyisobutyrate dehydrogenase-like beta-hydroxyacid dehydrogenase